jgi:hypothetical protein
VNIPRALMLASSPALGPDSFHVRAPSQLRIPAARLWVTTTISKLRSVYSPIRTLAGVASPSVGLATQGVALKLVTGYMTKIYLGRVQQVNIGFVAHLENAAIGTNDAHPNHLGREIAESCPRSMSTGKRNADRADRADRSDH